MYTKANSAKTPRISSSPLSSRAGFSLVEVTMALGLMSFCLVAMLGMLPVGLNQERNATDQLGAAQLFAAVESDFQNQLTAEGQTRKYSINTAVGSSASFLVDTAGNPTTQPAKATYGVWYQVSAPGADQSSRQMHLYITRAQGNELAQRNVVAEGIVLN